MMSSCLTSCGGATFSKEAQLALPDVVEYSRETQSKAADELEENDIPVLREFMKDYSVMRDQTRRAKGMFSRLFGR